jgi:hypothetical protein
MFNLFIGPLLSKVHDGRRAARPAAGRGGNRVEMHPVPLQPYGFRREPSGRPAHTRIPSHRTQSSGKVFHNRIDSKKQFRAFSSRRIYMQNRYEGFLKRHASLVHPNHFLFTSARQSLSQLYGRDEKYLLNTLTTNQLERKVAICRQLLDVADVVEPGLTRIRGM